jgi:tetratricopeptide (TPR) repeat protein
VICFTAGLLSKENAVLFPLAAAGLIFIFNHRQKKEKKTFLYILPLVVVDILYIILHSKFTGAQGLLQDFSFSDFFLIFKTIGVYTKIILTPFFPAPYFSMEQFEQARWSFYIYFLAAPALLVWVILKRKEYRYTLYSLLFFIFLLPVLDPAIIPTNPRIAFRFAYIPVILAGVFLMDTLQFLKNKKIKTLFIALLIVMSGIWAVETIRFQGYFKDSVGYYRQLVRHYPDDSTLLLPLALQKAGTRDYGKALELINHALAVNRGDRWGDISEPAGLLKANLMVISGNTADAGEGRATAEKILLETKEKGMKYFAFLVLAKFYEKKQVYPFALEMLEKARNIGETSDLFFRMTIVCAKMKNYRNALLYLEKARSMNPALPKYHELKNALLNAQSTKEEYSP